MVKISLFLKTYSCRTTVLLTCALRRSNNIKFAVFISSITFGMGHIVNLLNGKDLIPTLLQICYAVAIGFLFTIIIYKGKSFLLYNMFIVI